MQASQVGDGQRAALLHVEPPVLARGQRAAEAERHLPVGGGAGQATDEVGVLARVPDHIHQRRHDLETAEHVPEVEAHRRAHEVRAVRILEALVEHAAPAAGRHPPARVARKHVRVVLAEAATGQTGVDLRGGGREEIVGLRPALVGERQRVVLIRGERELPPRDAAEPHPRPRHRRGSVPRERQVHEPGRDRVALHRERAAHVGRVEARGQKRGLELRHPLRHDLHERVLVGRLVDLSPQREHAALTRGDVLHGHHAHHLPALGHERLPQPRVEQLNQRLPNRALRGHAQRGRAHRRAHRVVASETGAEHPLAEIRVGHDSGSVRQLDIGRGHMVLGEDPCGVAHARVSRHAHRRPLSHRAHTRAGQLG